MLGNNHNTQAGAPGLAMDNVIEFPQPADSATETGVPRATADTGTPTSLVQIWNRAGSRHSLDGVPVEVLDTLQRLKDADRPGALCVLRLNEYRLHWSTVKIDRTFLTDIPHESNAGRIVAAIVAMAGELGLRVTAEGVETEAQYRFLSEAGCHFGQGFGYARPQPAADFLRLLQRPEASGCAKQTDND